MSSKRFGNARVFAAEASSQTFLKLLKNSGLNRNRFTCLNCALSQRSDEEVVFVTEDRKHAAAHIRHRSAAKSDHSLLEERVPTLAIDDLFERYVVHPGSEIIVLKLDVEGEEINVLKGASNVLRERDVLLIYEDHGADEACQVTSFAIDNAMSVYFLSPASKLMRIRSVEDARIQKRSKHIGYNFFACRSGGKIEKVLLNATG